MLAGDDGFYAELQRQYAYSRDPRLAGQAPQSTLSGISHYLKHYADNSVAHIKDVPEIYSALEEAGNEVEQYDRFLTGLGAFQDWIVDRRRMLLKAKSQLRAAVRPSIRRIPPEILRLIFELCCEDARDTPTRLSSDISTPLAITLTCRQWYEVAIATPLLWSHIGIELRQRKSLSLDQIQARTLLFLERSKDEPLDICIDATPRARNVPQGQDRLPFEELLKHTHRWKTARLVFPDYYDLRLPVSFPILEELHLQSRNFTCHGRARLVAPRLTQVALIQRNNIDSALNILNDGSHRALSRLELTGRFVLRRKVAHTVLNSHLRTLCLRGMIPFHDIFQGLTLPNLQELVLHLKDHGNPRFPVPGFLRFLNRSQPPLAVLAIKEFDMRAQELIDILLQVPSVVQLSVVEPRVSLHGIRSHIIGDEFLHYMMLTSNNPLLPNLTGLHLGYQHSYFDGEALVEMLSSRCDSGKVSRADPYPFSDEGARSPSVLRQFTLGRGQLPDLDRFSRHRFSALKREGLKVTIL